MADIVERLRGYLPDPCADCNRWNECGYGLPCDCECHESPCSDAAAEIERLRAEVARLGAFLHPIGEKARRG